MLHQIYRYDFLKLQSLRTGRAGDCLSPWTYHKCPDRRPQLLPEWLPVPDKPGFGQYLIVDEWGKRLPSYSYRLVGNNGQIFEEKTDVEGLTDPLPESAHPVVVPRSRARMDGIVGVAFAAGKGRVAGTMMVSNPCWLIVVVEDGGSLVLGCTGCRPSDLGGDGISYPSSHQMGSREGATPGFSGWHLPVRGRNPKSEI